MKRVTLIRHAKSDWNNDLCDFDRPLNHRGLKDAPFMGSLMRKMGLEFDAIISSSATRAKITAKLVADEIGCDNIEFNRGIYECVAQDLIDIISGVNDRYSSILIVGHNPTITQTINILGDIYLMNLVTSAFVTIEFDIKNFKSITSKRGKQLFFEYPKKYRVGYE